MKFFRQWKKKGRALLCVLLSAALVTTSLSAGGLTVIAQGAERTFDIGVNPESVTATLTENGVLTISGSGAIRDFTADTAPFADCQVKSVKLGADLTSIGSYTFYNCGELSGSLVLPKGLLRIGDRAFSGGSAALAPKPGSVENGFTEAKVTKKRETAVEDPSAVSQPDPTPAPAVDDPASGSQDDASSLGDTAPGEGQNAVSSAAQEVEALQENQQEEKQDSKPDSGEAEGTPAPESRPEENSSGEQSSAVSSTESGNETKYVIERITQQEIGEEIFYPRTDGPAFFCSAENESFREAMLAAGYREAGTMLPVTFQCGKGSCADGDTVTKTLPVLDGKITLPAAPAEFSAPEGDGLYTYSFCGWTETKDAPNTLREAGSAFAVGDRTDLYFIANWNGSVTAKITVKQDGDSKVFTVPALEGYEILSYRWQTCVLAAGEALPLKQDTLAWKDISGETSQSYRWKIVPTETGRLFRCVATVQKQQNFLQALFSADDQEEAAFDAVEAIPLAAADDGGTASPGAQIVRGRRFSAGFSGDNPTIMTTGSVTAHIVSKYTPSGSIFGSTRRYLRLYQKAEDGTLSQKAFSSGTKIVLGDMSNGGCTYYSHTSTALEQLTGIPLTSFESLTGSGSYVLPSDSTTEVVENLIFVVDFLGSTEMTTGEYCLGMVSGLFGSSNDGAHASFTVAAEESCSLGMERTETDEFTWGCTLTPQIPAHNSRYAAGAFIHLWATSPDGTRSYRFPEELVVSGDCENVMAEEDGSLTFTIPASGSSSVFLNFSSVPELVFLDGEYQLHASLTPRAGLQMIGRQGTADAEAAVGVSLYRGEEEQQRSVGVAPGGETQRLVDASEEAVDMVFLLEYRGIRQGDTLQYEVLQKTGKSPDNSSYSSASGDWSFSPAPGFTPTGDGATLHLTVPRGQERGTYRLLVRIVDASGASVAEQPYNFIVK